MDNTSLVSTTDKGLLKAVLRLVSNSRADSLLKEKGRNKVGSLARSLFLKQLPQLRDWKQVIKTMYGVCVRAGLLTTLIQTASTIWV